MPSRAWRAFSYSLDPCGRPQIPVDNYEFCTLFAAELLGRPTGAILDYGCGDARIVEMLRAQGYDASGCEVFYAGGDVRARIAPDLLRDGLVRDMPEGRIPFPDMTFDLVLSNQVIEHVPDLELTLSEMRRVLRPGGIVLSLYPDKGTWREGHCAIPFLHWFPKGSRTRVWYASALRSLGLGYFKGEKGIVQWSKDFCKWIDDWCYYRPYRELRQSFDRHFTEFRHHEAFWMATRFPATRFAPEFVRRAIARRWAGVVTTCRRPI